MRGLKLTLMIFCQVLLAAFLLHSRLAAGAPPGQLVASSEAAREADRSGPLEPLVAKASAEPAKAPAVDALRPAASPEVPVLAAPAKPVEPLEARSGAPKVQPLMAAAPAPAAQVLVPSVKVSVAEAQEPTKLEARSALPAAERQLAAGAKPALEQPAKEVVVKEALAAPPNFPALITPVKVSQPVQVAGFQVVQPAGAGAAAKAPPASSSPQEPLVKGGQGPLHLLASSLCRYQAEKPVADETLSQLYIQRAAARKTLFDFMSLKFTNLEKLSSRLNAGLEVRPRKAGQAEGELPSHGWPVVGKCTAHDLKLMSEAAWCECSEEASCSPVAGGAPKQAAPAAAAEPSRQQAPAPVSVAPAESPVKVFSGSRQQRRAQLAQAIEASVQQPAPALGSVAPIASGAPAPPTAEQPSSVVWRLLHVSDAPLREAAAVDSSMVAALNMSQPELMAAAAAAAAQTTPPSTRECRINALKLTKALFNHLAEDQSARSESWPKLYTAMADDECARKRMIDVVTALSSFRSESTSIRRDNVEFAFAMDDLRPKVLENEVNVPLTFDKQFIEVEQFLQQSVKLMLANIDPGRARLTSMRYRSLMPGPVSADDQCIELHQRLLAKNYPTDCNPTQFGQLPDVLRMAAHSIELWSIEQELAKHSAARAQAAPAAPLDANVVAPVKEDLNECIRNLVSS